MVFGRFMDRLLRPATDVVAPESFDSDPFAMDEPEDVLYGVEPLRILISPLAEDTQGLAARHIHDRLSGRTGMSIMVADRALTAPGADHSNPLFVSMAIDLGRRWLRRENADLLIWGESIATQRGQSWRMRFLGRTTALHPHSATISALERLEVPALFDDATGDLAFGTALAAVNVESADGIRARICSDPCGAPPRISPRAIPSARWPNAPRPRHVMPL